MRVVQWIHDRWTRSGLPLARLAELSGLSVRTLYRIERRSPNCRLRRDTIERLGKPLRYSPAVAKFLIVHRDDEFEPDELEQLACAVDDCTTPVPVSDPVIQQIREDVQELQQLRHVVIRIARLLGLPGFERAASQSSFVSTPQLPQFDAL
jgi:transcriptional regulator with XRE-family HTH domain